MFRLELWDLGCEGKGPFRCGFERGLGEVTWQEVDCIAIIYSGVFRDIMHMPEV